MTQAPPPLPPPPPSPGRPTLPRAIWILGGVSLLMDVSSEMIHGLLPLFLVDSLGASAFVVGMIEGLGEATSLVVKVFSGTLSDYLGRRKRLTVLGYGLSALTKPLFALAGTVHLVLGARILDRVGKGIRGAPRDALIADIAPRELRGAAFGLRQSLDTIGAFLGPLIAVALMLAWHDRFRAVFWVAVAPALLAVVLLELGVAEPVRPPAAGAVRRNPLRRESLRQLGGAYWWVVLIGGLATLARFSEAFLLLRAQQDGVRVAYVPLVMVAMNVVYSACAYPFGRLADRISHPRLLAAGLAVLILADLALARGRSWPMLALGVGLWGVHMGITQGLLAAMVTDAAPAPLRGTAFGLFNLASGGAMLVASGLAGWIWSQAGAGYTFYAGATFAALALGAILVWRPSRPALPETMLKR